MPEKAPGKEELVERSQVVRLYEANCGIAHADNHDLLFRLGLTKKISAQLGGGGKVKELPKEEMIERARVIRLYVANCRIARPNTRDLELRGELMAQLAKAFELRVTRKAAEAVRERGQNPFV